MYDLNFAFYALVVICVAYFTVADYIFFPRQLECDKVVRRKEKEDAWMDTEP